MNRLIISLPPGLHARASALARSRGLSLAALVRETLASGLVAGAPRLAEPRGQHVAEEAVEEEPEAMKRILVSLPDELYERLRILRATSGISMAAMVRNLLDERTRRERPKPRFGAFASGYTDTARLAGEMPYEPLSWR